MYTICGVGVRFCEEREGDMNPGKLVLVVVWGCLFIVYCCTKVVYAFSVRIPAKDTLSLSCFGRDVRDMLSPTLFNSCIKIFCGLSVFQSLLM